MGDLNVAGSKSNIRRNQNMNNSEKQILIDSILKKDRNQDISEKQIFIDSILKKQKNGT